MRFSKFGRATMTELALYGCVEASTIAAPGRARTPGRELLVTSRRLEDLHGCSRGSICSAGRSRKTAEFRLRPTKGVKFNERPVTVLPSGISDDSGLIAALGELKLPAHNVVS